MLRVSVDAADTMRCGHVARVGTLDDPELSVLRPAYGLANLTAQW